MTKIELDYDAILKEMHQEKRRLRVAPAPEITPDDEVEMVDAVAGVLEKAVSGLPGIVRFFLNVTLLDRIAAEIVARVERLLIRKIRQLKEDL